MSRPFAIIPIKAIVPNETSPSPRRHKPPAAEILFSGTVLWAPRHLTPIPAVGDHINIHQHSPPPLEFPNSQAIVESVHECYPWTLRRDLHARHILVPYPLHLDVSKDILENLRHIFFGTRSVCCTGTTVVVNIESLPLPPKPWPATIGGLPLFLTYGYFVPVSGCHLRAVGLKEKTCVWPPYRPRDIYGNRSIKLCADYNTLKPDYTYDELLVLLDEIQNYWHKEIGLEGLIMVLFALETHGFIFVLADDVEIALIRPKMPGVIAHTLPRYFHEADLRRPQWVRRGHEGRKLPPEIIHTQQFDDTTYGELRPGIMMASHVESSPHAVLSTSGVLVRDRNSGEEFMTATSHGIGNDGRVRQQGSDEVFGTAAREIRGTDVTLVKLRLGTEFSNETFANQDGVGPRFTKLRDSKATPVRLSHGQGETLTMNNPFTGHWDGAVTAMGAEVTKTDEGGYEWTRQRWVYTGGITDEGSGPPPGVCGSALWDAEDAIAGFYRYHISEGDFAGHAVIVEASEVAERGNLELVDTVLSTVYR